MTLISWKCVVWEGGGGNLSIFSYNNAPKVDIVGVDVLSKEEHEQSYCGDCIGRKTERMYIKEDCKVKPNKDNMWDVITKLVSAEIYGI